MNLLDMFKKSKKGHMLTASLGQLWVCAVKFEPWKKDWYDVKIMETDIKEAYVRHDEMQVESTTQNPFNKHDPITLHGPVGRLEYASWSYQYVGFFETRKAAEDAYRLFATGLVQQIESTSSELVTP